MRSLTYLVATSIDGYIAAEDGDFTPLLLDGDHLRWPYPHLQQYVAARSLTDVPRDVTLFSGDLLAQVRALKRLPGLAIWLCGGGTVAAQLLPEIDSLFLKITPVVLGDGIPLFRGAVPPLRFRRTGTREFTSGVTFVEYARR